MRASRCDDDLRRNHPCGAGVLACTEPPGICPCGTGILPGSAHVLACPPIPTQRNPHPTLHSPRRFRRDRAAAGIARPRRGQGRTFPRASTSSPSARSRRHCSCQPLSVGCLIRSPAPTTRCHGIRPASGQCSSTQPTSRARPGSRAARAIWPYVRICPGGIVRICSRMRRCMALGPAYSPRRRLCRLMGRFGLMRRFVNAGPPAGNRTCGSKRTGLRRPQFLVPSLDMRIR